jgi:hypothetical protein
VGVTGSLKANIQVNVMVTIKVNATVKATVKATVPVKATDSHSPRPEGTANLQFIGL